MARTTLIDSLPTVADMAAHILTAWNALDAETIAAGRRWYADAHAVAAEVAATLDAPVSVGAGLVAGYSPATEWNLNVRMARATAASREPVAHRFGGSTRAKRMLAGEAPATVVTGLKIGAFYRSILDPAAVATEVVVDRHAFAIATGRHSEEGTRFLSNAKVVAMIAEAYRVAATALGEAPGHVQAATWIPRAAGSKN